jgi:hypothetical protein
MKVKKIVHLNDVWLTRSIGAISFPMFESISGSSLTRIRSETNEFLWGCTGFSLSSTITDKQTITPLDS